ncbi:pentapeptide repeat-containing protein [Enterobacter ludwigii]|uniref:pentapeptide repeat-containing protein n=1 Tax=Enterobacter ludwigii TaxID=299767 RepID=UPI0015866139|nr:pentapeptide repeat-containing protein [Enterobacter ludwigii]
MKKVLTYFYERPVFAALSTFSIYLLIVFLLTAFFPWLSIHILPNTFTGLYNKQFWEGVLVNLNSSVVDFFVFGVILFYFHKKGESNSIISSMLNELSDIAKYDDIQLNLRKVGILKRLSSLGHDIYTLHRIAIGGAGVEIRDVKIRKSDFTALNAKKVYINTLSVIETSLRSSDFSESKIRNARFDSCNFRNTNFEKTTSVGNKFNNCDFKNANFKNSNFKSSIFLGSSFEGVNFEGCNLNRTNLKNATNIDITELCKAADLNYIIAEQSIISQIKTMRPDVKFSK